MTFKTNDAAETMRGNRYVAPFYGDKGAAFQYLTERAAYLRERIAGYRKALRGADGIDAWHYREWIRQDENEHARCINGAMVRE